MIASIIPPQEGAPRRELARRGRPPRREKGTFMGLLTAVILLGALQTTAHAAQRLSPVHPDETVEYTLEERFSLDDALESVKFIRSALSSFRELTAKCTGKIPRASLRETGNTEAETQNLAFTNIPNSIEGTLRKQDLAIKQLEFDLAAARKELGRVSAEEVKAKREALDKAEQEFRVFWESFSVAD